MKNALLAVSVRYNGGNYKYVNIGDSIQALAAYQYFDKITLFIQRELLNSHSGDPCNMIMNGWYMDHPENWPPSPNINPLYVALHINSKTKDLMLTKESIEHFKKHEPIGCRDKRTESILRERGVNSYFSGCLTLTLGEKYSSEERDGKCYIVDVPVWRVLSTKEKISLITSSICNFLSIIKLYKKGAYVALGAQKGINGLKYIALFYYDYCKIFTKTTLLSAEYIAHTIKKDNKTDEQLLDIAKDLVCKYSKASLVITNRIHCALPCLGLETPVIYIDDIKHGNESRCRFDGLLELFNIVNWDSQEGGLCKPPFNIVGKISVRNMPTNKTSYKSLKDNLIARCKLFVNKM